MNLIHELVKSATFQTELLVMTLLGLANCTLSWCPFDWTSQAEKIGKVPMTSVYSEEIKNVLRWVVITRIIIDHIYFASYLGNLYSVLTWCRPKLLLPWMIISAFKNFLLELIPFVVAALLYLEGNFPGVLFLEFIVESAITFAPAAYYWLGIQQLYVILSRIQERKLTREQLIVPSGTDNLIGTTLADDINVEQKKFTSLTNFDELSFHSTLELAENCMRYRLTKSLTTLLSMNSQSSVEPEENLKIMIMEDPTLTPAEKALKILGLSQDDVNEARVRLKKSILVNPLKKKELEDQTKKTYIKPLPISTEKVTGEVRTHEEKSLQRNKSDDERQATMNIQKIIELSFTQGPLKELKKNGNTWQNFTRKTPGMSPNRCTCSKLNDTSLNVNARENVQKPFIPISQAGENSQAERNYGMTFENGANYQLKSFGPSLFWSVEFPRSTAYKTSGDLTIKNCHEDAQNSENKIQSSLQDDHTLRSLFTGNVGKGDLEGLHSTSEHLKRTSVELSGASEISLEQQKQSEDNTGDSGNELAQENFGEAPHQHSFFRVDDTFPEESKRTEENFENSTSLRSWLKLDIQIDGNAVSVQRRIEDVSEINFPPNISRTSASAQTNISELWEKTVTNLKGPSKAADRYSSNSSQSKLEDQPTQTKKMSPSGLALSRVSKTRKRSANIEEREAREMRALRAYNRLTLLEDKREMDMKKRNKQAMLCGTNFVSIPTRNVREILKPEPKQSLETETIPANVDQLLKRQTRSRPQESTSRLSAFNVSLSNLENSISMSFSNQNKNRSTLYHVKNNSKQLPTSTQQDGRRQLSKYSKQANIVDGTNVSLPSAARIEGSQTGQDLVKTTGVENMTHRISFHESDRDIERHNQNRLHKVLSQTTLSVPENLQTRHFEGVDNKTVEFQDKYGIASLKEAIKNIDWRFNDHNSLRDGLAQHENGATSHGNALYDIIDDTDTISLLQSAFASNTSNTERGFYLGPASAELYSVANFLGNVIEEIMKTTRPKTNVKAFTAEPNTEVDYGDNYFQEFEVTTLISTENSDEETFVDSNSDAEKSDDKIIEEVTSEINVPSKPVEMSRSSYSSEGIDTIKAGCQHSVKMTGLVNRETEDHFHSDDIKDRMIAKNPDGRRSITELLGEQEIGYVEYWTKMLKDLASNNRSNDFGLTKDFRHLTTLPGYYVIKMLVDFFRDIATVSTSTMTSGMFIGADSASSTSSVGSEEFLTGHFHDFSDTSDILNNLESVRIIDRNVSDCLEALIDQLIEDLTNDSPLGTRGYQTMFPLRDDQFYFGTGATRRFVKSISTSEPEVQDEEVIPDSNENLANSDGESVPTETEAKNITGATTIICTCQGQEAALTKNAEAPFRNSSEADSSDSFFLSGVARNSKSSNNVASIGAPSSFEEFPEDTS